MTPEGVEELAKRLEELARQNGWHYSMPKSLNKAATLLRQQAERIAQLEADLAKVIRARNEWEDACQSAKADLAAVRGKRLWIWRNFVNGRPEYWAFDNPYPCEADGGDPLTLGEPCGYAIFKESTQGRFDVPDEQVIAAIVRALAYGSGT